MNPLKYIPSREFESRAASARPAPLWWIAHAIAGVCLAAVPLWGGVITLSHGVIRIPIGRGGGRLIIDGGWAMPFGIGLLLLAVAAFAHGFLTCFTRISNPAAAVAKYACGAGLMLVVIVLLGRIIAD